MGHRDFANPVTASGVTWLLVSLVLAAVADLVTDVPSYFGTALPVLGTLSGTASYERYSPILIVVVPTMVGVIGFGGILRIERGRGWTRDWRSERARPALLAASIAAAFLFGSGLVLELFHVSTEDAWNPVRMTVRFVLVLAVGVYLLETAARIDPGPRIRFAKSALVVGAFAAAVRMFIAIHNGFFASKSASDFVSSQVEPLLSPAAFVLAVVSLFGWFAIYIRILGRFAPIRAGGRAQQRLPFRPHPYPDGLPVRSEAAVAIATNRPPAPARPPESTTRATSPDSLEGLNR